MTFEVIAGTTGGDFFRLPSLYLSTHFSISMGRILCYSLWALLLLAGCIPGKRAHQRPSKNFVNHIPAGGKLVYQTPDLELTLLAPGVYMHTSFLQTQDFGKVPCNGMIVWHQDTALVFDTPVTAAAAEDLVRIFASHYKATIKAVVATHFHLDCVGELEVFHRHGIPSYATSQTIALAAGRQFSVPQHAIETPYTFTAGDWRVIAAYYGAGHTQDNIVAWLPGQSVLFGGCLLKAWDASKGNLEDADTTQWSHTIRLVQAAYPGVNIVIPGHGSPGGAGLLQYTADLFANKQH